MNKQRFFISSIVLFLLMIALVATSTTAQAASWRHRSEKRSTVVPAPTPITVPEIITPTIPVDTFSGFQFTGTLEETGNQSDSLSADWWLNSGGLMTAQGATGATIQGDLSASNRWYDIYRSSNPVDTDNGAHPQNIWRLQTTSRWQNYRQEAYFTITKNNLSLSANRNASNGLFFFNREQDADNLYYTGLRVDGFAVIKKKINGVYHTLALNRVFAGVYNRDTNPNLLPLNSRLGLRSVLTTLADNTVNIKVYIDQTGSGNWQLASEANDSGVTYGNAPFLASGYAGLRTDFMDVKFDGYRLSAL